MSTKQYEELGKGLIGLANFIGGLSVINGLFGATHNLPVGLAVFLVGYTFVSLYVAALILIGTKGNNDD